MTELLAALGADFAAVRALIERLRARGETVACAESLTAGLVCAALTCVPGSSAVVRGGLVVYATDLKSALADVDTGLLAEYGAVHPQVAAQLAAGARDRCAATWGIGLTGVAGPDPQDGVAPGTVHIAVRGPSVAARTLRLSGTREEVRAASVRGVLALLGEQIDTPTG